MPAEGTPARRLNEVTSQIETGRLSPDHPFKGNEGHEDERGDCEEGDSKENAMHARCLPPSASW
jgi:hypothetical protein